MWRRILSLDIRQGDNRNLYYPDMLLKYRCKENSGNQKPPPELNIVYTNKTAFTQPSLSGSLVI